uniref:Biogenesis of lysosome-related organelles complex 1 subunit 6 n=1 Tax=Eptatretus burgeri TaxID=7764 RepID=A0A8C4Q3K2_EPTBU
MEPAEHLECELVGDAQGDPGGFIVADESLQKLSEGLTRHYLPDLKRLQRALGELTQNQSVLLDTLGQENVKLQEFRAAGNVSTMLTEAKAYQQKLVNIRREMISLHERTSRLKKRAMKLQQQKQKDELKQEEQREKELQREKSLLAKPAKRS